MKDMILVIEELGNDLKIPTVVSTERTYMKEEMFKISQWGAMHRWTKAITQDFTNFTAKFKDMNIKSSSLKKIIDTKEENHKKDIKQYITKIKELEDREKCLKSKIRNGEAVGANAEKRIQDLEIKIMFQKQTIEHLKRELQDLGKHIVDIGSNFIQLFLCPINAFCCSLASFESIKNV
ncbi:hypothetical protein C0J52_23402 [Blattella germanica]|nr:hypothetical protein C0J52_23402 [Blattella germanica]